MRRYIYRSILKEGAGLRVESTSEDDRSGIRNLVDNGKLMTLSLYRLGMSLFLYYECSGDTLAPGQLFPGFDNVLETRPDDRGGLKWIPMADIFHFSEPRDAEHWRRKDPVHRRVGMAARIKSEMLSSYIYHHYLLQETQLLIINKYCMIGLDGNLIFYYEEQPVVSETRIGKGKPDSHYMSSDWMDTWQEIMEPHFIKWNDVSESEKNLRPCEMLFECAQDTAIRISRREA